MNFNKFNHRHRKKPPLIRIALLITVILVCFFALRNTVVFSSNKASREIDGTKARLDSLNRLISFETQRIEELKSSIYTRNGQIQPGQGMFQALNDLGLSIETSLKIVNTLSDSVELLHLSVGEPVSVDLDPRDTSRVLSFSYSPNPSITHKLINRDSTFVYERIERPTEVRYRTVEGNIEEGSSLDQTLHSEGIPSTMVGVVNGILLCKIPFRTHARAGDHFKVLLKERFFQDTIRIDGEVLYASYEGTRAGFYEAFFYNDGDLKSSFTAHYTADGEALIHSGLRYPLRQATHKFIVRQAYSPCDWQILHARGSRLQGTERDTGICGSSRNRGDLKLRQWKRQLHSYPPLRQIHLLLSASQPESCG